MWLCCQEVLSVHDWEEKNMMEIYIHFVIGRRLEKWQKLFAF